MKNILLALLLTITYYSNAQITVGPTESLRIGGKTYVGDRIGILAGQEVILQQPLEKNLIIVRVVPESGDQPDGQAVLRQDEKTNEWITISIRFPSKENEYQVITWATATDGFVWVYYKNQKGAVSSLMFPITGGW